MSFRHFLKGEINMHYSDEEIKFLEVETDRAY